MAGVLHIGMASEHALCKAIDASGIDTYTIEAGIYTSAALRRIYSCKAYKRGVDYHDQFSNYDDDVRCYSSE